MEDRQIYSSLTIAGTAPFLACALLPFAGYEAVAPFGSLETLVAGYGLGILSFLTGIHWATQLYAPEKAPFNLFIGSNVVFLFVWIAYATAGMTVTLLAQLMAFPALLLIDYRLEKIGMISRHYLGMRFIATAVASLSLLLILVS
jgi:hypothetical protein